MLRMLREEFQSPGRDSGPSRSRMPDVPIGARYRFNPLVGIPVLHGHHRDRKRGPEVRFNPLVGIPVLHG